MKHFKLLTISIFFLACNLINAQQTPSSSSDILNGLIEKTELTKNSLVKNIEFTNIGPTVMSGRVVDLAVNPNDPTEFYVAYASDGVWHTVNNGTTFTPILDSDNAVKIYNKKHKEVPLKKADNGNAYLKKGIYII